MKCPHCSEEVADAVPLSRLKAKNEAIEKLEADVKTARAELEAAGESVAEVARLQRRLDKATTQLEAVQTEYAEHRTQTETAQSLMRAGITDQEDMELARWRYSRLEDPPPFAEWLTGGAKEDRMMARLLEAPAESADPTPPDPVAPPRAAAPPESAGVRGSGGPTPPPSYTPADISSMPVDQLREALKAKHI